MKGDFQKRETEKYFFQKEERRKSKERKNMQKGSFKLF